MIVSPQWSRPQHAARLFMFNAQTCSVLLLMARTLAWKRAGTRKVEGGLKSSRPGCTGGWRRRWSWCLLTRWWVRPPCPGCRLRRCNRSPPWSIRQACQDPWCPCGQFPYINLTQHFPLHSTLFHVNRVLCVQDCFWYRRVSIRFYLNLSSSCRLVYCWYCLIL